MRPRFIVPFFTLGAILLAHPLSHADTRVLTAEATYIMGDGESPAFAEAQVLQRAKQMALEGAGTYVETYTKIHNYDLTTEEIQTIAGGVLEVQVLEKKRVLVGDSLQFYVKIKATVTTDKMEELAQRIKGKNVAEEYKKLQAEYARLSRELETWKQLAAKTPQGPEREAALDQIREREKAFARIQKNEQALFQRLVSGQALVAEGEDDKALVDRLIESIKKDGHILEIGKVKAFPSKGAQDRVTVTVPISLKPSAILPSLLSDAARSLGGNEVHPISTSIVAKYKKGPFVYKDWPSYFVTLEYRVFDGFNKELRSRVTTKFEPSRSNIPVDSIYRNLPLGSGYSGSGYRVGMPGTMVRLSPIQSVQAYFRERVQQMFLRVELDYDDSGSAALSCTVPFIVNRLVAAKENSRAPGDLIALRGEPQFYIQFGWRPENKNIDEEASSLLLLFESARFSVEFDLAASLVKSVNRLTARWVDAQDSPVEVCRIVIENY